MKVDYVGHNAPNYIFEKETIRLIMLSGGSDSCAVLIRELTETSYKIHIHHVKLHNRQDRALAEKNAVVKIVEYCRKHYRPFSFSTNTLTFKSVAQSDFITQDVITIGFVAGMVAKSIMKGLGNKYRVDVVVGAILEDVMEDTQEEYLNNEKCLGRRMALQSNFTYEIKNGMEVPQILIPYAHLSKLEMHEFIPEELRPYVSSCRSPFYIENKSISCGVCKTCNQLS